jgi:hypothetical protein
MKRLLRIGIVTLAAAVVLFAAFHFVRAQGEGQGSRSRKPTPQFVEPLTYVTGSPGVPHFLTANYFSQGFPETWESAGVPHPVDSLTTFKCPLPCTLEIDQKVNVGWNDGEPADWIWLGAVVDGSLTTAPYYTAVDELPEDESWVMGVMDQTVCLKAGTHTVQSWLEADQGAELWDYHINYRVYVP